MSGIRELAARYGVNIPRAELAASEGLIAHDHMPGGGLSERMPQTTTGVLVQAAQEVPPHWRDGHPSEIWEYCSESGDLVFKVCRWDLGDGAKEVRPLMYVKGADGSHAWVYKGPTGPRPLFRLDALAAQPGVTALVTEGEKTASAAARLFPDWASTTSSGGSSAVRKSNWSPLRHRDVIIFPDNDAAGRQYADDVAKVALEAGAVSVRIVQVPESWPPGWDLGDFNDPSRQQPQGLSLELLRQMIDQAQPYRGSSNDSRPRPATVPKTAADEIVGLSEEFSLFHTPDLKPHADVVTDGIRRTFAVRSSAFRRLLGKRRFDVTGRAANDTAMKAATETIEGKAIYGSPEHRVHLRTASLAETMYIDLGDETWEAIEVDKSGWRIVQSPPVRFHRPPHMMALCRPKSGGAVKRLLEVLNVKPDQLVLIVSWLVAALRPTGPYPALCLNGEQGSAKSTLCRIVRHMIDPCEPAHMPLPRSDQDLHICCQNNYAPVFDNISSITGDMSDRLCRIATGGGFSTRRLYSDDEETVFASCRPMILNGIEEFVTRQDLADRTIVLTLDPIADANRKTEREIWQTVEAVRPEVLGGLLDIIVHGLGRHETVVLPNKPRMADFAVWATACETLTWPAGTFMRAFAGNRATMAADAIEADEVAALIGRLMSSVETWSGTATELAKQLANLADEKAVNQKGWPRNARSLSGRIKRLAPLLRRVGLDAVFVRQGRSGTRTIVLSRLDCTGFASASSEHQESKKNGRQSTDAPWDTTDAAPPLADATSPSFSGEKARKSTAADDADAGDGRGPGQDGVSEFQPHDSWRATA
jgi:hypothetical protein